MISEKRLEKLLLKDICEGCFADKIDKKELNSESSSTTDSFFNRLIEKRYRENVNEILGALNGDINLINVEGDSIKSISMDSNKLLPDILALSVETNDYLIFELKVKKQTEREAVTELFAYETELVNHVPLIERSSIRRIIISTEFGSSLKHAVTNIILHGDSILCITPVIDHDEIISYSIVNAYEWTVVSYDIQHDLSKGIFNGVGLCFYNGSDKKSISEKEVIQDMNFAVDLLRDIDNRVGGNGFCFIWKREGKAESKIEKKQTDYIVYTFAINPYLVYLRDVNGRKDCLSKYICQYILNSDRLEDGTQEYKNAWKRVKALFDDKYCIMWESPMNLYQNLMYFKESCIVGINSWGELGQEMKETYLKSMLLRNSGLAFDDPDVFLKLLVYLYDEYPFKRNNGLGEVFHLAMYIGAFEEVCKIHMYDDELEIGENCTEYKEYEESQGNGCKNSVLNKIRNLWKIIFCSMGKIKSELLKTSIIKIKGETIPEVIDTISKFKEYLYQQNPNNKYLMSLAERYCSFSWELREYDLQPVFDYNEIDLNDRSDFFDNFQDKTPGELQEVFDFCTLRIIERCKDDKVIRAEAKELLWSLVAQYDKEKGYREITEKDIIKIMRSGDIKIESDKIEVTEMIGYMRELLNIYGRFSDGEVIHV